MDKFRNDTKLYTEEVDKHFVLRDERLCASYDIRITQYRIDRILDNITNPIVTGGRTP